MRWPEIEPLLKKATELTDGAFLPIDVLCLTLKGQMTIWAALDGKDTIGAVAVLEIRQYPRRRACDIPFVAARPGTMRDWLQPMLQAIEAQARRFGCDRLTGGGRIGWARAAGFTEKGVSVFKDL